MFNNGDFRFFYPENIKNFASFPFAWDSILNTGLGQSQLSSLWITSYLNFTASFSKLGLSWDLIQLIFWIIPALLLSFFSSSYLFKHIFKDLKYSILAGIIYTLNTYFLMILTGGQLGIALSYSLVPLVFLTFVKILENPKFKNFVLAGLVLGFQILFDPRIVYITLIAVFFYLFFNFSNLKIIKNKFYFLLPFVIAFLLNSFWIFPLIFTKNSSLSVGFDSVSSFRFFSFAKLENSISFLHPNWPENIFGKVYFLKPEFLILPILAFSSLLFNKNKVILFFSSLALIGVFLAKGSNEPLGFVNEFLFKHFLGMSMFRDPTKWYIFLALSYSILIPYAIKKISKYFRFTFILFIMYFLYLVTPIFGQVKINQVPQEYVQLKNFLDSQKNFSRTLWIPSWQRFGYFSNNHPAIGREELLKGNAKKQISQLDQSLLKDFSIKYVIVPYDSQDEIFLKDRKYDDSLYKIILSGVSKISYLKKVEGFGKIGVFEVSSPKDHFWSSSRSLSLTYKYVSPVEYSVNVKDAKKGDMVIFAESYDSKWIAKNSEFEVQSSEFNGRLNSFVLPKEGDYNIKIYYTPQKYVEVGLAISLVTFVSVVAFLVLPLKRRKSR